MVTWSPLAINYDASLHLSFLAVIGIIYTQKYFESKIGFITNFFEIRTAISITLSALVFTFPVMMFNF
jgi:predicted membrane metal-binding protein